MEKRKKTKLSMTIDYLESRVRTDFCWDCPENKNITCEPIIKKAWEIGFDHNFSLDNLDDEVNKFVCPYNVERLVSQK